MPRPIQATIHTAALRHNLARARRAAPDARVWAIVKANAYGHGIEHVFEGLRAADGFALLDLDEAQRVRSLGWRGPILLLEGAFELRDLELCSRLDLWHTVHCDEQIDMLATHKTKVPQRVFLKMNSGMNRLGFTPQRYRAAWTRLNALPQVDEISLMTHFSDADGARGVKEQMAVFAEVTRDLPGERSLSNSAATLRHTPASPAQGRPHESYVASDWVRPGIAIYGSSPDFPQHSAADWDLQPSMTLTSKIIATQSIDTGATVGYGSLFVAEGPMQLGVVACGYADGYPRVCPTGTPVLVGGVRTRTLGRVSMDMLAVDLSGVLASGAQAGVGSEVTLWGHAANGAVLGIDEVAHAAGTVGYELMCALAKRVPVMVAP
ncbi:MAG: alanine racemase [Gammaproteobacteria bacterium]|uniref:alanine racemase n=1 Tax=Rhodoferax sp. TaxID=50421 RepID=UPI00183E25F0|nr:alanine racemase [Rhodoferax sp.]MBU3897352.1 alanine racemase [Gammaproteobacteria bacterium]MBA3058830.1 alanine racemase [Rhodoferax sp.]MBU3999231.1 alanine racemase [Gammaproteobacteria bacterium]MBU4018698.1 alanine racemase [Gammaproteobacteria bacterium]MBU4079653.1 alanine racemase [Gammaproteobacteria bacterium]